MKAVSRHIYAVTKVFEFWMKGEFLMYLIPYAVIGLIFGYFIYGIDASAAESAVKSNDGWFSSVVSWVSSSMLSFLSFFLNQITAFLLLTLLSPVASILSEKLDNRLTGQTFDGGLARIITDVLRAVGIVFVTLILELVFMLVWFLISKLLFFIPGIELISSIVYFIIPAFFFGLSFYDFSLERYQFSIGQSWTYARRNKLHMMLTGGLFSLILMIPFIGLIIAPVFLTMVSTIVFLKMNEDTSQEASPVITTSPIVDSTINSSQIPDVNE
jgi:CysZ protein